jgi:endoglucanase
MLVACFFTAKVDAKCENEWVYWDDFARNHIQKDGRVIDYDANSTTTSEGQAYALFFSLIANDRERFDRVLRWTTDNLAQGDLQRKLPGWQWGKSEKRKWEILDENSASDADLWIAYSLFQAGEKWDKSYFKTANYMLSNIAKYEVVDLPNLGKMLLPGKEGFKVDDKTWRLNPSYMPIQILRYFDSRDKEGPWAEIASNTVKMIEASVVRGVVPDWVTYKSKVGFVDDIKAGHVSSFDAIRVYLWWGMLNKEDPFFLRMKNLLKDVPQFELNNRFLPEKILARTGDEEGVAPSGFVGALAPYRFNFFEQYPTQSWPPINFDLGYYNSVLNLFGFGWLERRYSFNLDGSLTMRSHQECLK